MRMIYRQWLITGIFLPLIGIALFLSFSPDDAEKDRQGIALAQVQELLSSHSRTAGYRLIPESVMTGLCWPGPGGAKEGLFKDIHSGTAHWRERAPLAPDYTGKSIGSPAVFAANASARYVQLSSGLDRLSFEPTGFSYSRQAAEITGVLSIGDHSRRVALKVDLSDTTSAKTPKDLIELTASAAINPADFGDTFVDAVHQPIGLCIAMQAARREVLMSLPPDQPLMLSHYY